MKLIVEMEMPRFCAECPMCDNVYYGDDVRKSFCIVFDERKEILTVDRPSWCPIKGVLPETHGRLIDEAVFCENVVKYSHQSTKTIGKALDATPTIIEMTPIVTERKDDEQIH